MEQRELYMATWESLVKYQKMVFISGPRQSGKTTFSQLIGQNFTNVLYFNYDIGKNKKRIIEDPFFYEEVNRVDSSKPLIIFDEIHKYSDWKNYLKGIFDRHGDDYQFLVTGSGRLDLYQKGGDSLAGRYFMMHLWPFTLAERANRRRNIDEFLRNPLDIRISDESQTWNIWEALFSYSGFPDPYLKGEDHFYTLWSETYKRQLVREDIRDLTGIQKIDTVEILAELLPGKVGSTLSINSIAGDLKVSFDTVKSWLKSFDDFFVTFRLQPWTKKITRAITKEKKCYLFDYGSIEDEPARFENMVALELYRAVTSWTERGYGVFSLRYIRNRENEEVDFLIAEKNNPLLLVECKFNDEKPSRVLQKMQKALQVPAVQLIHSKGQYRIYSNDTQKLCVVSADQWVSTLP